MGHMQKMRGLKLLTAFYEEIVNAVPKGAMSTVEILGAAQALIECSREDCIDVHHPLEIARKAYPKLIQWGQYACWTT